MTLYHGPPLPAGPITLVRPNAAVLVRALTDAEITQHQKGWFERARSGETLVFLVIERKEATIGQILLHDIDQEKKEALVGYHIFEPEQRGRGFGTAALGALCRFAFDDLDFRQLLIITTPDNSASRRIAAKCGFRELGPAREGPHTVAYERLDAEPAVSRDAGDDPGRTA